ncbi:MAG: formylmethanofuran dehydrogenase subunit B [Methanobacteriaceae archaeon]|jgi:formylmethanofuran dehydrogenase subunit B
MIEEYTNIVCPFCGCLCDDGVVLVENNEIVGTRNLCRIGHRKFIHAQEGRNKPQIRKNGELVPVSINEALDKAAEILANANRPLLYGWSATNSEAQKIGCDLTQACRGVIDNTATLCHAPSLIAVQDQGYPSCTLGEVMNRADLIIYWGSNPFHAHPRHMSRYSVYPRGMFRPRGRKSRTIITVDPRQTDTAKLSDLHIQIAPGADHMLAHTMREILNSYDVTHETVAGIPADAIRETVEAVGQHQWGILFFGMGLTQQLGKDRNIDVAIKFIEEVNKYMGTKMSLMPMRGHYNVAGANITISAELGPPYAIDCSRGYPRYHPGETTAMDLLYRGEIDAMLNIAANPGTSFSNRAMAHIAKIPVINIEPHNQQFIELSDVVIPPAISGIECVGTAYRMDNIPILLRKVVEPPEGHYPDTAILSAILERVEKIKGSETV